MSVMVCSNLDEGSVLRCDSIIKEDIHAPLMNFGDRVSPGLNCTIVLIKQSSIQN